MEPIIIKRTFIDILKIFFNTDEVFTWDIDPLKTKIVIADIYSVDRSNFEQYPLLAVARGRVGFNETCLGNFIGAHWKKSEGKFPDNVYESQVVGNIVFHCLSYSGIEAESIAMKAGNYLEMTKQDIGEVYKIQMDNIAIDDERQLKDWPPGLVDVPLGFRYIYNTRWKITDFSAKIRNSVVSNKN